MQSNQTVRSTGEDPQVPLRVLAAAAHNATWAIQPADSPVINYEAFGRLFHADREVVDWLIKRIQEKYGCAEVCNAQVERELEKLRNQIQLDLAYEDEAVWLISPVDVRGIAERHGIDQEIIEACVEQMAITRRLEQLTNGDMLFLIARVRADQVTYPAEGRGEICTVKTDPAYQQHLTQLLGESAFLSSPDVDIRAIAHYYEMTEREVKQVMAFLALQGGEQLTNGRIITSIDQAAGDWLSLGLLPDTNELLSTEEAIRLGISTPYIPCECGERMYKGDGINTLFGPYCSEECVHRYVCLSYALAGFVTDEDVANPNHPIYHLYMEEKFGRIGRSFLPVYHGQTFLLNWICSGMQTEKTCGPTRQATEGRERTNTARPTFPATLAITAKQCFRKRHWATCSARNSAYRRPNFHVKMAKQYFHLHHWICKHEAPQH